MEHDTGFDYTGNPFSGNPYSNCTLLTPSIFNASDVDFSNMLNFTPLIGNSEMAMLNMPGDSRLTASNFLGDYTSGSEFPFPAIPANTYTLLSAVASTMAPADLSMPPDSNFPAHGLPRPVPQQDQSEPQSASLQAKQRTERQEQLSETTRSAGQKRAQPATTSAGAGEEPKPKRRRGARKKVRTEEEIAIRRENHLQRNRDAAQKCRQKKKLTEAEKREQMAKERHDNHIIWNQVAAVQDELESLRNFTLDIESHCQSSDHKTVAKTSLELITKTAAKLQDKVDTCNQRRAEISQGLIMQKSYGGYTQQDSMQDSQSPEMSPQSSNGLPENLRLIRSNSNAKLTVGDLPERMVSKGAGYRLMTRASAYNALQQNTELVNSVNMCRKGSNSSPKHPDSAVDFNSPSEGTKNSPIEDEAIENQVYSKEEPLRWI